MQGFSTSILGRVYQGMITLWSQWRDLHSQSWGWGHDEQPRLVNEPAPAKAGSSPLASSI